MNQPCLQLYLGDLLREPSFLGLTLAAQGLWLRMLMLMHDACEPGALVNANGMRMTCETLARIVAHPPTEIQTLLDEMEKLGTFSRLPDGTIYNRRMYKKTSRSEKARASANARWHPAKSCDSNATTHAKHASSSSSSSSSDACDASGGKPQDSSLHEKPVKKTGETHPQPPLLPKLAATAAGAARVGAGPPPANGNGHGWFEQFYAAYWRKKAPDDARRAFTRIVKTPELFERVMAAVSRQTPEMMSRPPDKRPYPATWLNAGSYADEAEPKPQPKPDSRELREKYFREILKRQGILQ